MNLCAPDAPQPGARPEGAVLRFRVFGSDQWKRLGSKPLRTDLTRRLDDFDEVTLGLHDGINRLVG